MAAPFAMTSSIEFVKAIREALGIPPGCDRVVIEADVQKPLKVYIRGFVSKSAIGTIVQAVQEIAVSENGYVTLTPLPPE